MEDVLFNILLFGGMAAFFAVGIYAIWLHNKTGKEILQISSQRSMPSKILPISRIKEATINDIADYERLGQEIQKIVDGGSTSHSSHQVNQLRMNFRNWALMNYFIAKHKGLFITALLLFLPIGWIPFLVYVGISAIQYNAAVKLEKIFNEYFQGRLFNSQVSTQNTVSTADEITKLHQLKQQGVLSEDEFVAAKKRLVG